MKSHLLFSSLLILFLNVKSQSVNLKFSEEIPFSEDVTFYYKRMFGNEDFVYTLLERRKKSETLPEMELIALSSSDLKEVNRLAIYIDKLEFEDGKKRSSVSVVNMSVEDTEIRVLWYSRLNGSKEYLSQTISLDLKKMSPIKSLYTAAWVDGKSKQSYVSCLYNEDLKQYCFLDELPANYNESITAKVTVLNKNNNLEKSFEVDLPFGKLDEKAHKFESGSPLEKRRRCLAGPFKFDNHKNVWFDSNFDLGKKERKLRQNENSGRDSLPHFSGVIDTENEKLFHTSFQNLGGKYLFGNERIETKTGYNLVGFYSERIPGYRPMYHGIYFIKTDNKFNIVDTIFNRFTDDFLFRAYEKDKPWKWLRRYSEKKLKAYYEQDRLNYIENILEEVFVSKDGAIYVISSPSLSSYERVLNDNNSVSTYYTTYKKDIMTIKLNSEGRIQWGKNISRIYVYGGYRCTYYKDILVKEDGDKLIYAFKSEKRPVDGKYKKYSRAYSYKYEPVQIVTIDKNTSEFSQSNFLNERNLSKSKTLQIGDSYYTYYFVDKIRYGVHFHKKIILEKITPKA